MNYHLEMENIIQRMDTTQRKQRLLLHSCCAPCSSYVLLCLKDVFEITLYYYNPNILPQEEYQKRERTQRILLQKEPFVSAGISYVEGAYEPHCFLEEIKGLEQTCEGGVRCLRCYELRLKETAMLAKREGYDYFATTLTISPHKRAESINAIGQRIAGEYQTAFLPSDFKKKGGYAQSVALSKQYGLYRQRYCGCNLP